MAKWKLVCNCWEDTNERFSNSQVLLSSDWIIHRNVVIPRAYSFVVRIRNCSRALTFSWVTPLVVLDVMRTRIRLRCSVCRQSALFNALSFLHSGSFPSTRVRDADFQRSRWSFLSARRILVIANTLNIVLSSREVAESPCQEVLGSEYWVRTFKISYVDFVPRTGQEMEVRP